MKVTKLKNQFYIFQAIFSLLLFLVLGITYFSYQHQYDKDIDKFIHNELKIHKKEIMTSITDATEKFNKRKDHYKIIHAELLSLLNKDPNLTLNELKKYIKSQYLSSSVDVELFLIDSSYTIFDTTFPKDLGFNLSIVKEAKIYLDHTTKDGKIYISDTISTDALDMKYKLYSYAKLKEGVYLEIGFIDNTLTNLMESFLQLEPSNVSKVTLYNVSKDDTQYYYYSMKKRDDKLKEKFYNTLIQLPLNVPTKDNVINCIKQDRDIELIDNNIYTIYTKLFEQNISDILGFENIVMKLDIDVSKKIEFMKKVESIFIASIIIVTILLIILFVFIRNKFTYPIEGIVESLKQQKKVEDAKIISLNNELSQIALKYNTLYDDLRKEIELNKRLTLIDPLTKALNRKAFDTTMAEVFSTYHRYQTPFTLILFDIDDFKKINDNYGHSAGDNVLKEMVQLINSTIRTTDKLYRIGGEEFILICKHSIKSDALQIAEKLRTTIENSLNVIEDHVITISVGVTEVVKLDTQDSIYQRVDQNLYLSKTNGKNMISAD